MKYTYRKTEDGKEVLDPDGNVIVTVKPPYRNPDPRISKEILLAEFDKDKTESLMAAMFGPSKYDE